MNFFSRSLPPITDFMVYSVFAWLHSYVGRHHRLSLALSACPVCLSISVGIKVTLYPVHQV